MTAYDAAYLESPAGHLHQVIHLSVSRSLPHLGEGAHI